MHCYFCAVACLRNLFVVFLCFEPWLALLSLSDDLIFGLLATQDIVFLKDDAYEAEILLSSVIDYYSQ